MALTLEQRTQVVTLKRSGKSWTEVLQVIRDKFGWSPVRRTCLYLWKKYKKTGSVEDLPRSGRPRKLDVREERKLRRCAIANRKYTLQELANDLKASTGKSLSKASAASVLKKYGLKRRVAVRKPLLSPKMRHDRYAWALKHAKWSVRNWKRVLFSDEKIFKTDNDRCVVLVTRTKAEKYARSCIVPTKKHGPQVHVWGVMSWHGVGPLRRVVGTLDGAQYRNDIVHDVHIFGPDLVRTYGRPVFQQDKAPAHWAKLTLQHFKDRNVKVLDWPGNSPDMNPIENLWSDVAKRVRGVVVSNSEELFEIVARAWDEVSLDYVRSLYRGMPRRVLSAKAARGGNTRY
jgi:transposase